MKLQCVKVKPQKAKFPWLLVGPHLNSVRDKVNALGCSWSPTLWLAHPAFLNYATAGAQVSIPLYFLCLNNRGSRKDGPAVGRLPRNLSTWLSIDCLSWSNDHGQDRILWNLMRLNWLGSTCARSFYHQLKEKKSPITGEQFSFPRLGFSRPKNHMGWFEFNSTE